jgi:hypothetical protein
LFVDERNFQVFKPELRVVINGAGRTPTRLVSTKKILDLRLEVSQETIYGIFHLLNSNTCAFWWGQMNRGQGV